MFSERKLQQEVEHLRQMIHKQEREVQDFEEKCRAVEDELRDFRERYDKKVKPLIDQIDVARKALDALKELQWQRLMGGAETMEDVFANVRRPVEQVPIDDPDLLPQHGQARTADNLKKLYRKLARQYHPDLAQNPDERERRTRIMSLINQAYQEEDFDSLEALEEATPQTARGPAAERLVIDSSVPIIVLMHRRLQRQYYDLTARLRDLKIRYSNLRNGSMMELKIEYSLAKARGEDLLDTMAKDLQREFFDYQHQLDELRREVYNDE